MKHVQSSETGYIIEEENWDDPERLGGAMELRVSVRSLVQQLVHEQAKASVHLEGLQRDVTTLMDFREHVMEDGATSSALAAGRRVSHPPAALRHCDPATSSDPGDPDRSGGTSGLGTSGTSGTSAASAPGGGQAGSGGAAWRPAVPRGDGGGGDCVAPDASGDELLQLLETIEAHGRRLLRQNRRLAADDAPPAVAGARPRCRRCHGPGPDPDPGPGPEPADPADGRLHDARNPGVRLYPGLGRPQGAAEALLTDRSPLLADRSPVLADRSPVLADRSPLLTDRSPLLADQSPLLADRSLLPSECLPPWDRTGMSRSTPAAAAAAADCPPLSLPDLRPRHEFLSALTLTERLLRERDRLLDQLAGLEQVAVRSQLHAASLQSRLQRVLVLNEALDRELRLAGGLMMTPAASDPRSRPRLASAGPDRMARSAPDLRPPSRIPQPLSLRRRVVNARARSPQLPGVKGARSTASTVTRETQTDDTVFPLGISSAENPTGEDLSAGLVESTTPALRNPPPPAVGISTTSIGVSTSSVGISTTAAESATQRSEGHGGPGGPVSRSDSAAPGAARSGARPPDRTRVSAILGETSPLKLQRELLVLLVEAEALRAEVDSLGRRWAARVSSGKDEPEDASRQAENDELRLQLEVRNIELEGTRARLRQLEATCAARSQPSAARSDGTSLAPSRQEPSAGAPRQPGADASCTSAARSGNLPDVALPCGGQADGLRRPCRQAGTRSPSADGADQSAAAAVGAGTQSRSSRRPQGLATESPRPDQQAAATSGSFAKPAASGAASGACGVSNGPSKADRRPGTPTRAARAPSSSSRPSSRCDTPSGRAHRSKTPTRPGSRSSLSAASGNPPRAPSAPGNPPKSGAGGSGRRVSELVRGWTEAAPGSTRSRPASADQRRESELCPGPAADIADHREKVRRRAPLEPSAKIPATQSQALGQILAALSGGRSPRRLDTPTDGRSDGRSPAELRWLREAAAQRLRQARLETSDGEVADSLTSATASEDGGDTSLDDRLKALDEGLLRAGGGLRQGALAEDALVLSAGEGLIQRILRGRGAAGQRLRPRPPAQ